MPTLPSSSNPNTTTASSATGPVHPSLPPAQNHTQTHTQAQASSSTGGLFTRHRPTPTQRASPTYRSNRALVYSVGVAVIAGCGSIIGAYLKSYYQAAYPDSKASLTKRTAAYGGLEEKIAGGGERGDAQVVRNQETMKVGGGVAGGAVKAVEGVSVREIERAIGTLETLRGQLVQRKVQEEQRLKGLKERVRRREELEREKMSLAATAGGGGEGRGR